MFAGMWTGCVLGSFSLLTNMQGMKRCGVHGVRAQIERFVRGKLEVCRWVGLAVLLVQLISLGLAYMVSSAQQRVLEARCTGPLPEPAHGIFTGCD